MRDREKVFIEELTQSKTSFGIGDDGVVLGDFVVANDAFFEGKGIQLAGHNTQFDVQFIKKNGTIQFIVCVVFVLKGMSYQKTGVRHVTFLSGVVCT